MWDRLRIALAFFWFAVISFGQLGWGERSSKGFYSSWLLRGDPLSAQVILIEDLHYSRECQHSIVDTVLNLLKKRTVRTIFLEGAEKGKIDLSVWRFVSSIGKARQVIERLWRKGSLSAGEYLALRLGDRVEFRGLEDPLLYIQHLNLMKSWVPTLKVTRKDIYPEKFWRLARKRDREFIEEILGYISQSNPTPIVIIVGGFHAKTLLPELEKHSISVAYLRPKVYSLFDREKEGYLNSFLGLSMDLALPLRVDYRIKSERFWSLWNTIVSQVRIERDLVYPLRIPYPIWTDLLSALEKADKDLFYLVKGRGFSWTDYFGNVHTINEILYSSLENGEEKASFLWGLLADRLKGFYDRDDMDLEESIEFVQRLVQVHERLHWLLVNFPSIKKKIYTSAKKILGDKLDIYLDWIGRVYGQVPRRFKLRQEKGEDWYLGELLVISYQECYLRGIEDRRSALFDYVRALERLKVSLPEKKEEFVNSLERLSELWDPYLSSKRSKKRKVAEEKILFEDLALVDSVSSKKLKKLIRLVLDKYQGKTFPDGETYVHHVLSLFTFIYSHRPRDVSLSAISLVHLMDLEDAKAVLDEAGFSKKEIDPLIEQLKIYKLIFDFPYRFDPNTPLPSSEFLNNLNDYFYQLIMYSSNRGSKRILSGFRLSVCDLLVSLSEEGVFSEQDKERYINLAKYLLIPLAERLGETWLFFELKDLVYEHESPVIYYKALAQIRELLNGKTEKEFSETIISKVYSVVPDLDEYKYSWRMKSISSTLEKMSRRKLNFSELKDIFGMKIVVPTQKKAKEITENLQRCFSSSIERKEVEKDVSYFVLQFKYGKVPCEIQIRTEEAEEILERTYRAHWRYNLKKWLPALWRDQKFTTRDLGKDPVFLLVKTFLYPRLSIKSEWKLIRFSQLKEKYQKILGKARRLYGFSPYQYFFTPDPVTSIELDLTYFSPDFVLTCMKNQPNSVFVYSNEVSLAEIIQWIKTCFNSSSSSSSSGKYLLRTALFLVANLFGGYILDFPLGHIFAGLLPIAIGHTNFTTPLFARFITSDGQEVVIRKENKNELIARLGSTEYRIHLFKSEEKKEAVLHIRDNIPWNVLEVLIKEIKKKLRRDQLLFISFTPYLPLNSTITDPLIQQEGALKLTDTVFLCPPDNLKDILLILNKLSLRRKYLLTDVVAPSEWEDLFREKTRWEFIYKLYYVCYNKLQHIELQSRLNLRPEEAQAEFLRSILSSIQNIWLNIDLRDVLKNWQNQIKVAYPDIQIQIRNHLRSNKLCSYAFLPMLLEEISRRFIETGKDKIRIDTHWEDGALHIRIQFGEKKLEGSPWCNLKLTESLLEQIRLLQKVGGDCYVHGTRQSLFPALDKLKAGTIIPWILADIEIRLPAGKNGGKAFSNTHPVVVIVGKNKNEIRWTAIKYASKLDYYYIPLDEILKEMLTRLTREHKELFHLLSESRSDRWEDVLSQVIETYFSNLLFKSDGLYWSGINLNLLGFGLEEDYFADDSKVQTIIETIALHLLNLVKTKALSEVKKLGYTGIVIGTSYPIPVEKGDQVSVIHVNHVESQDNTNLR